MKYYFYMSMENAKIQQQDNNKVEYSKPVVYKLGHACIALRSTRAWRVSKKLISQLSTSICTIF